MADIADVMDALEAIALGAVFPNGTDQPSVLPSPKVVAVGQGWPLAGDLDKLVAKGTHTLVSIYAVPSSTSETGQPFNTQDEIVGEPQIGLAVSTDDTGLTLSGAPNPGEYVTVETADGQVFSALAEAGASATSVADLLAAQLATAYPGTTVSGGRVTILPASPRVNAQQGGPATLAKRIHRQRTQFRISVWSSNPADRAKVGRCVDVALKASNVIRLPDQTQGLVTYMGTNLDDKWEDEGVYRRDLIFNVAYDTIETYTAYVVTTVQVSVQPNG